MPRPFASAASFADARSVMQRAIELAALGIGSVEPNPAVGAVIVDDQLRLLGEGYHEQFGGPHAEVQALRNAGADVRGATAFVTLEPCCHTGKTPPCTQALISAGIRKVVVGMRDPSPHVAGQGLLQLAQAGIETETGLLEEDIRVLNAPFLKLLSQKTPYVHAKWAMTLDGKIASRTGASQWISNEASRRVVHELRGRMDAVIVGSRTAMLDNPYLTARPPGPRTPVRIVVDSQARLPVESQLIATQSEAPVLLATLDTAAAPACKQLEDAGAEVLRLPAEEFTDGNRHVDLLCLLQELGARHMTNVLIEGGGALLGNLFDRGLIDEVHIFMAPKIVGGAAAISPLGGVGLEKIPQRLQFSQQEIRNLEGDIYFRGVLAPTGI